MGETGDQQRASSRSDCDEHFATHKVKGISHRYKDVYLGVLGPLEQFFSYVLHLCVYRCQIIVMAARVED